MKCESDCSGVKEYSDGIFSYCMCSARIMNTACAANITHKTNGNRPAKVVEISMEGANDVQK